MTDADEHRALLEATQALMAPLARLLVARGVPYASAEESLKAAMVDAARAAHPEGLPHRLVSRIATSTGINRREVTRLTRAPESPVVPRRSIAAELFARWGTSPLYRDAQGHPRVLPRQGEAPSFESLARSVTQDVHPRSLLDELLRLGFASHDAASDTVSVVLEDFVPSSDRTRMLEFLGNNVGDHLAAAVENVIGQAPRHLERAVFAHDLSADSIAAAEQWVSQYWQQMLATLVPFLERLLAQDDADPGRARGHRFRAGLYAFAQRDPGGGTADASIPAGAVEDASRDRKSQAALPDAARSNAVNQNAAPDAAAPPTAAHKTARTPRTR